MSTSAVSLRLSPDAIRQLDLLVEQGDRDRSAIVEEALAVYFETLASEPSTEDVASGIAYHQQLEQALQQTRSGEAHSGEQIFAWMRSWGKADEQAPPHPDVVLEKASSGLVVSHEDMSAWLRSWGRDDELPPPVAKVRA